MKSFIGQICLGFIIATMLPTIIPADNIAPLSTGKAYYMVLADQMAARYDISALQLKAVFKHESDYDPTALGDHGKAYSISQYHRNTFNQYEALYFKATGNHLNYASGEDQERLTAWQWKNYPASKSEWSTYRALYVNKK